MVLVVVIIQKFLEIWLCLAPAQDPTHQYMVSKAEGTTDVS